MTTVGIDFGNINCSVAVNQNDRNEVVADAGGHRQLPSVVTYNEDKKSFIGVESIKIFSRFPKSTISDLKILLGCASVEEAKKAKKWDFQVVEGKNGNVAAQFVFDGKEHQVNSLDVAQLLLQQLKKTSEDATGQKATKVVITHPFHSPVELKNSLLEASKRLGWNDVHFVSEQAAAIIAYELDDIDESAIDKQAIVIDFGTNLRISHVSILRGVIVVKNVLNFPEVNSKLFETAMIKNFGGEFQRKYKLDINESRRSIIRLSEECDRVKGVLSQVQQASANVEGLMEGIDFSSNITRAKFEMINSATFGLFTTSLKQAITTFGIDPDYIILSGGNCKIPKIQQIVQTNFPDKKILNSIDPTEVQAKGASLQAKYLQERNQMVHGKKVKKLVHAITQSIGIESAGGNFVPIILKDTPAPLKVVRKFTVDQETCVVLNIYEGESKVVSENKKLAVLKIPDVPDQVLKKGEVTLQFNVNEEGIFSVQASQQTILASLKLDGKI